MQLQYELTQREIEESLLCLDWKREGRAKRWNLLALGLIAAGCLAGYVLDPSRFFLVCIAGLTTVMMFLLLYVPEYRRKRRAKKMAAPGGLYQIAVPKEGIRKGFESEHVFTIQSDQESYCIPKRILKSEEQQELREVLEHHAEEMLVVKTGRSREDER